YFKTIYYLPEAALKEKRFKELYGEWRRQGLITITPGNVVDYDYILNDIMTVYGKTYIVKIAYDSWNATQFAINAETNGLPIEPFSQTIGNFNRATKEMERLLLSGKAVIDNNTINRHCFRNVVMARDRNGNTKPSKQFEEKKIDGVIAMLEALGVYLVSPRYNPLL
ncbi:MAG: terminase TerL endonuclease subunit, partial [Bacteroides sp.]